MEEPDMTEFKFDGKALQSAFMGGTLLGLAFSAIGFVYGRRRNQRMQQLLMLQVQTEKRWINEIDKVDMDEAQKVRLLSTMKDDTDFIISAVSAMGIETPDVIAG